MYLIDTNILIYSGEPGYASLLLPYVTDTANGVSLISHIETLGFHRITPSHAACTSRHLAQSKPIFLRKYL